MATSLAIKRRIRSVQSIKQVTKTLQVISASRMKKVQEAAQKLKAYADELNEILLEVSQNSNLDDNKYFNKRDGKNLVVLISPTRGQAGALPSALVGKLFKWMKEENIDSSQTSFICVNKKGFRAVKKQGLDVLSYYEFTHKSDVVSLEPALEEIVNKFTSEGYSNVYLVYPKFINALRQEPVVKQLLPIEKPVQEEGKESDFVFEPSKSEILEELIPHYIEVSLYDAIVNNSASEESSRMIAMKNATDNAKEMIEDLTLTFNKARQAKITQQVAEISAAL